MPKQDTYPPKSPVVGADYLTGVDSTGPSTIRVLISTILTYVWSLANIPAGATSPITRDNESQFAFVASGGVWSGDSYNVNRNASMTALVCYINGRRISIAAVSARTFTASTDTYIDVLDNGDGTGTLVYTEVTNNAASPVLAANSMRIGIIITGASAIVNSGSVNQGQETMVLPIASSTPYTVTDSLGNLICPGDPMHKVLGYRQITSTLSTSSTSVVAATGLAAPIIAPGNRKLKITVFVPNVNMGVGSKTLNVNIYSGVSIGTLTTQLNGSGGAGVAFGGTPYTIMAFKTQASGFTAISVGWTSDPGGGVSSTLNCGATDPAFLLIELD